MVVAFIMIWLVSAGAWEKGLGREEIREVASSPEVAAAGAEEKGPGQAGHRLGWVGPGH